METVLEKDVYKTSRFLYILEAAFEYFISILVGGAYLAKVSAEIGLSDGLTGILTSFVSLGCGFQIIAIFLANKTPVKRWVTLLHSLNQLFFALIYLVPFIQISKTGKTVLFILFLLAGHIINNVVNSPKLNWFMSLVDDRQRGRFTANKEILSLLGGMIFSFVVGAIIDHFETLGDVNNAFIFCGFGVLGLTILHTLTLLFSKEKPIEKKEKVSIKQQLKELLKDRDLFKVILISVFWNISHYVATPFYGSYQIGALGFSMSFVAILSALYAVFRSLFSRPMGKYADKYSFAKMLNICFIIMVVAFAINTFTVPANGKIFYTAYYTLYAIGMAGINSGEMNLIYDCVDREKRVGALALKSTLSGFAGFFTTLFVSPLVDKIQANGNTFLGLNVYAQQVVSALAMILTLALLIYLNAVVRKVQRKN